MDYGGHLATWATVSSVEERAPFHSVGREECWHPSYSVGCLLVFLGLILAANGQNKGINLD